MKEESETSGILSCNGIKVIVNEKLSVQAAVIDKALVWYGSISYLGYNDSEDHAIKLRDLELAGEVIDMLYKEH